MALTIPSPNGVAVETTIGRLYARYLTESDFSDLEKIEDLDRIGLLAIQLAASRNTGVEFQPLQDLDLYRLSDKDQLALAAEIARQSGIRWSPDRPILGSFGVGIKQRIEDLRNENRKMRESIAQSYRFLNEPTAVRLHEQLKELSRLTPSAQDLRDHWAHAFQPTSARQVHEEAQRREAERAKLSQLAETIIQVPIPQHYQPPQFEETPLGEATLESVRSIREVSQKMDALVEVVGGINKTLVIEILPAWIKQVEEEQSAANKNFQHAAKSLTWTKWAVITSVIVSVLVTWWQISVTREIDAGSYEQSKKIEKLTNELLSAQMRMIELQEASIKRPEPNSKDK